MTSRILFTVVTLTVWFGCGAGSVACGAEPLVPVPDDYNQNEFAPRPAPKWVSIRDYGDTDPKLKGLRVPAGIKVEIVAEEPTTIDPVALSFDDNGEAYIIEWRQGDAKHGTYEVTFQNGSKGTVNRMFKTTRDEFKKLIDSDGDGVWDKTVTLMNDLEMTSTAVYHDGWWYLPSVGHVLRRRIVPRDSVFPLTVRRGSPDPAVSATEGLQKKQETSGQAAVARSGDRPQQEFPIKGEWSGKDIPTKRFPAALEGHDIIEQEIVRGLCGFHHHQASGVTFSFDGWMFITSGDDDNRAEGSDGSRATVLRTGAIFRCRPDGSQVTEHARGFRNPYRNVAFDHFGNMFHVDNDQEDGSKFQGVRLMHVLEGSDFGWRLFTGAVCCRTDFARGAVWGEKPGKVPSMLKTGRGSPAGLLIYQGTRFPDFFRGLLIYPDVFRKMVRAYRVEATGSTFKVVEQFELMASDDPLFRPCEAVTGPDGAIYIVDWRTDSGGAGKLWGDAQHGRIYRLTWSGLAGVPASAGKGPPEGGTPTPAIPRGSMDAWAKLAKGSEEELWKAVDSSDFAIRNRTVNRLVKQRRDATGDDAAKPFVQFALDKQKSVAGRIAAMGAACQLGGPTVRPMLWQLVVADNDDLRRTAADALGRVWSGSVTPNECQALVAGFKTGSPTARRSIALAAAKLVAGHKPDDDSRKFVASELLTAFQGGNVPRNERKPPDVQLADGLLRAFEICGLPLVPQLLHKSTNNRILKSGSGPILVSVLEGMRTREAAAVIDLILDAYRTEFSPDQIVRLLTAYRFIQVEPPINASAVVKFLQANPDVSADIQLAGLETIGLVGLGNEAAEQQSQVLTAIATKLLGHEQAETRLTAIRAIGNAELSSLNRELAAALKDSSKPPAERREILAALGKLRSRVLPFNNLSTPKGVELVLDDLATVAADPAQGDVRGDVLSLLAQVDFGKAEPVAIKMLGDNSNDSIVAGAAISVLAAKPDRAKEIGEQFVAGKLPKELLPRVAEALRRHVEKDTSGEIKKLLTDVFKGGLLIADVAKTADLVTKTGDPRRGRDIYLDKKRTQCATCHKLEGVGGEVGPDLSKTWETHTVAKLIESMLEPSKEIKEGFATWTVVTKDGKVYNGLKIAEVNKQFVLRDATGKDLRIPVDEIDEKAESKTSLMPEGVVSQLSLQEFIDLVSFLKSREAQAELRK
ncbi:MAG: PQQ-dependent sugar dehydrogenase [Planctomycetales bacterium]|nr:PQQ-dependent sugar dehydrogenase [Planctomycetales bacterium]